MNLTSVSGSAVFPLKLRQINCAVQWLFYKPSEICKRENYGSADTHSLQKKQNKTKTFLLENKTKTLYKHQKDLFDKQNGVI